MSLASLLELRRARMRPDGVNVILGTPPKWLQDGPDFVVIRPSDTPSLLDLRPLVGLPVLVVEMERNDVRFVRAVEAIQQAGGRINGLVSSAGATAATPEQETLLTRYREILCS